jgi:hypothetical protein
VNAFPPFERSISSPPAHQLSRPSSNNNNNRSNNIGQQQQQPTPLLGRSISYTSSNHTNNVNVNPEDGDIDEDSMLPSTENAANRAESQSATNVYDHCHCQFHVNAIQALLLDSPLPLAINSKLVLMQPSSSRCRQPRGASDNNQHNIFYLLPRIYMRKWCDWVRGDVIISCVDHWLREITRLTAASSNVEEVLFALPDHAIHTLAALSIVSDQYQLYTDHHHSDSDKYDNDNDNSKKNEELWNSWLDNVVRQCWMDWMTQVTARGLLLFCDNNKCSSSSSSNAEETNHHHHHDEKKEEDDVAIRKNESIIQQASQLFRDMFLQKLVQSSSSSFAPGPIDARILTRTGKPLQLNRNVSLMMKGLMINNTTAVAAANNINSNNRNNNDEGSTGNCRNNNNIVLTIQQEMNEKCLIDFLDSSKTTDNDDDNDDNNYHTTPHLAVSPVPSSFYEILRQTLGVICEDGHTISYQPSTSKNGGGHDVGNMSSLLYHDQWDVDSMIPSSAAAAAAVRKNMDIYYPSSPNTIVGGRGGAIFNTVPVTTNPHSTTVTNTTITTKQIVAPRPIEFRRQLLQSSSFIESDKSTTSKPTSAIAVSGPNKNDSYATLLREATQSKRESQGGGNNNDVKHSGGWTMINSVELHPVEFHYAIIDGAISSPLPPAAVRANSLRQSQKGIALASRASFAKDVLHELERAATPGCSNACVRLWMKSRPYVNIKAGVRGATKNGDGFELIDIDSLLSSRTEVSSLVPPPKPKTPPRSFGISNKGNYIPLTVGEWLKIEKSFQPSSNHSSHPVIVELLIEIRTSPSSRWIRESLELENRLQVGDFVDAQDVSRQWYEAIVREVTTDSVKVHFFGWGSKWDTILPLRKGSAAEGKMKSRSPPVPLWSKTSRWRELIKVGDEVEVRESSSLVQRPKWHRATVLRLGMEKDCPRELVGGAELELLDDNGSGTKMPLLLLNRKRQVLVEVPQERLNCRSPIPTVRSMNEDGQPVAQPPFIRWVNLYSEEICQVNTHMTPATTKQSDAPATARYVMESEREIVEVMKPYNNIHGSGFVRESLRGMPIARGTVGLHNLGNSW